MSGDLYGRWVEWDGIRYRILGVCGPGYMVMKAHEMPPARVSWLPAHHVRFVPSEEKRNQHDDYQTDARGARPEDADRGQ